MQTQYGLFHRQFKNDISRIVFLQKEKSMRALKGQTMVEYILLVTAVIAVIILFTCGSGSLFQTRLGNVFNQTTGDMLNVATRLQENAVNGS